MNPYDLMRSFSRLVSDLKESGGVVDEQWQAECDALVKSCPSVIDATYYRAQAHEAEADRYEAEANRLLHFAKVHRNEAKRAKEFALPIARDHYDLTGETVIPGEHVKLYYRQSTRVVVDNDAAVPDGYVRAKTSVDKTAVKKAIESGEDVPGCRLETGESVHWK